MRTTQLSENKIPIIIGGILLMVIVGLLAFGAYFLGIVLGYL